jgi:MFS transporter, DHA3 family, macrolide efflux protein
VRAFWIIWSGQAVSLLGTQAVQFALVWWITERTRSASILAASTFLALAPRSFSARSSAPWSIAGIGRRS